MLSMIDVWLKNARSNGSSAPYKRGCIVVVAWGRNPAAGAQKRLPLLPSGRGVRAPEHVGTLPSVKTPETCVGSHNFDRLLCPIASGRFQLQ